MNLMYACDYLEKGVLNTLLGVTFPAPSKCYLALYLSDPGESGTAGTEVSYPGYQRMEIQFSPPADAAGGLGIQNLTDITFPTPSAAVGTVTYIGVLDSPAGGNMLARNELVEPLSIGAEEPPVLLAGDVLLYLSGDSSRAWKTRVLNLFRGQSFQGVTPHYALWNGSPEAGGAELSGENYQRIPITFSSPEEQSSGQVLVRNSAPASFPRPTTNWGTLTHDVIYTAASSGEPVWIKARPEPKAIKRGYMPRFVEGAVVLGLN